MSKGEKLGVGMHEISKPVRSSAAIVKNTVRHQNASGAQKAAYRKRLEADSRIRLRAEPLGG